MHIDAHLGVDLVAVEATDKIAAAIDTGDMTDPSGGFLRSQQEARRGRGPAGATIVLPSDGHGRHTFGYKTRHQGGEVMPTAGPCEADFENTAAL